MKATASGEVKLIRKFRRGDWDELKVTLAKYFPQELRLVFVEDRNKNRAVIIEADTL